MCGRYALGFSIENLPQQFFEAVLNQNQSYDSINQSEQSSSYSGQDSHYETTSSIDGAVQSIQLNLSAHGFEASYNIPPTGTGVIIYMEKSKPTNPENGGDDGNGSLRPGETAEAGLSCREYDYSYRIEPSKFGLLPNWAKPQDSSRVKKSTGNATGAEYSREVQQHQAKLFNCRKETLAKPSTVWATPRKHTRCVVPISGYFELQNTKQGKVPHYVYSPGSPIIFLAGLYSHNFNYNGTEIVPKDAGYFSSFSIVTGPGTGKGKNDMSWLHSRKPIFIEPNSKAWHEWLRPDDRWDEALLESCLDTEKNVVYEGLSWHVVGKSVGNPANKGPEAIKEEKVKQHSIASFFAPRKATPKEEVKNIKEEKGIKEEVKEERGEVKREGESVKRKLGGHEGVEPKRVKHE